MGSSISLARRLYKSINPPSVPLSTSIPPIRFGILGAAAIAPMALILPAKSHSEVVVHAVAARDKTRAEVFARKHGIAKVYGGKNGYQELLDDPEIDAVYNPLPNGLHFEWTMKALKAGKHVLLEKPSADTADETREMYDLAERKGLVILEAFHYRFHPAIQRTKAILDSGELGTIKSVSTSLATPSIFFKDNDIRFDYALGGGALMDMGCYTINCMRYLSSSNPTSVIAASATLHKPRSQVPAILAAADKVDRSTTAVFSLSSPDATGSIMCDLAMPSRLGIPAWPRINAIVECTAGKLEIFNFVAPSIYHSITVTKHNMDGKATKTRVEKAYTFPQNGSAGRAVGEDWWTTYRFQLEAFVDRLRGRAPQTWLDREDAVSNMEWIERVYEKSGLGSRPRSAYVHSD